MSFLCSCAADSPTTCSAHPISEDARRYWDTLYRDQVSRLKIRIQDLERTVTIVNNSLYSSQKFSGEIYRLQEAKLTRSEDRLRRTQAALERAKEQRDTALSYLYSDFLSRDCGPHIRSDNAELEEILNGK